MPTDRHVARDRAGWRHALGPGINHREAARAHDAIRVTLTEGAHAIPHRPEFVGGGAGSGELVLNGGTWRYRQGTESGITTSPTEGVTLGQIKFNNRT